MSNDQKWHVGLICWEGSGIGEVSTNNLHKYVAEIEKELTRRGESCENEALQKQIDTEISVWRRTQDENESLLCENEIMREFLVVLSDWSHSGDEARTEAIGVLARVSTNSHQRR